MLRYQEPWRAYHTLRHIEECMEWVRAVEPETSDAPEMRLALFLHDAVYHPRASDNEERSAELAKLVLSGAGDDGCRAAVICPMILATKCHAPAEGMTAYLLDIDLAILGSSPERFAEYERQIRFEYRHVPGLCFRLARRKVLKGFLGRGSIFSTPFFRERLEGHARANLRRALGT
ncbi:MAG: N-methyl-D-aspartate receptor NMDAR2C subunit [Thermoanaerobaculia bacterium]|nr:N-methyl-D-aspartate receptor NMDAR2C subunit [Thermoanaerobaculia bacterium]